MHKETAMPRFTRGQRTQAEMLFGDVIESVGPDMGEFQQKVLDANRAELLQQRLRAMLVAMLAKYFVPLTDEEALAWLMEQVGKSEADAKQLVEGCRKGALEQGLANSVLCHFAVEPGATLKETIPTIGPCVEDFQRLQDWSFADVQTEHSLVSGVPVALRETTNQNLVTQLKTLAAIETRWGVPTGFFSRELIPTVYTAGVALTHHNVTQQQMFGDLWGRTGTCHSDGDRLGLVWREGRLLCGRWFWDEGSSSDIAVAALGVTKALGR